MTYTSYVLKCCLTYEKCCLRLPKSKELISAICFFTHWSTKLNFTSGFYQLRRCLYWSAKVNQRNKHWLAHDSKDVPVVAWIKFQACAHDMSIISIESDIMSPQLFHKGETIMMEPFWELYWINGWKQWPLGDFTSFNKIVHRLTQTI